MFGLDESIARLSDGSSAGLVLLAAALLGVRHATDPDHLAAVAALVGAGHDTVRRDARMLGFAWGLGHAVSLVALGIPIVLFSRTLPAHTLRAAELAVGAIVMLLSARVLVHWRRGYWHLHAHAHDGGLPHVHLHAHETGSARHAHRHPAPPVRTPVGAFGVGLVHGVAGSAGIAVVLLASVDARALAVGALIIFAGFTALCMTLISEGLGRAVTRAAQRGALALAIPALALATFVFGAYYGASGLGFTGST